MFEARLSQAVILRRIVEALKDLVSDVNLEVKADGISLQAMDASHVALVTFFLRSECFDDFKCNRSQSLGLSIGNLAKVMKCADNDDAVILKAENEASQLTFIFESKKDDKISEFNINLLSLDTEGLTIPEQEYSAIISMSSLEFARICRDFTQFSETLNINVRKDRVQFSVSGDSGEGSVSLANKQTNESGQTCIEATEPVNASFALRYLNLFCKAAGLGSVVGLSLSSDLPLVVHFLFELGEIKYYLAPKINEDL